MSRDGIQDPSKRYSPAGLQCYVYGINNPVRYTDPTGEWFFFDDIAALVVGAVIGAVSNLVSDLVKGDFNVADLIGDTVLGAVSGAVDVELQHNGIPVYISMNMRGMSAGVGFGGFCGGFTAGVGANMSWDGSGSYGVSASVGYGAPGQAGFGLSVGEQHTNAGGWTTNVGAGVTLGNGSISGSVGASATFGSDGFEGYGINAGLTGANAKGNFGGGSISSNFDKNGNYMNTSFGLTFGTTNEKGDSLSETETMTVDKDHNVSLSNSYSASLDLRQNAIYNGNRNFGGTGSTEYYNKDTLAAMQNTNRVNYDSQHALYEQSLTEQQMMSSQPATIGNGKGNLYAYAGYSDYKPMYGFAEAGTIKPTVSANENKSPEDPPIIFKDMKTAKAEDFAQLKDGTYVVSVDVADTTNNTVDAGFPKDFAKHTITMTIYTDEQGVRHFYATELQGTLLPDGSRLNNDRAMKALPGGSGFTDYELDQYKGEFDPNTKTGDFYKLFTRLQTEHATLYSPLATVQTAASQGYTLQNVAERMEYARNNLWGNPGYYVLGPNCNTYSRFIVDYAYNDSSIWRNINGAVGQGIQRAPVEGK